MRDEPPQGWETAPLSDLLISLESGSRPRGGVRSINEGVPSIGGEHVKYDGSFNFSSIKYVPKEFAGGMTKGHIQTNDILVVKDGATTGKTAFVNGSFPFRNAVVNEHVFICRPTDKIEPIFLFRFLMSKKGQDRVLENFKGSAQGGINQSFAPNTEVPLAPLNEQRRIVTKLDQLIPKVQSCQERLEVIPRILKRFHQSVLTSACSGNLIGKDSNKWESATLGTVLMAIQAGKSFNCEERPPKANEVGVVKVSSVSWGTFDELESKTCQDITRINPSYLIKRGDFLFSRANTIQLVGACVIVGEISKELMLSDKILRFRFSNRVIPQWILYCLQSDFGRSEIEKLSTGNQESMRNIGQNRIRQIRLRLPPLEEQQEIIRRVEALFKLADQIEARYQKAKASIDKLTQSILAKAFRGELVPQNPNDEPASILLGKIRAKRNKSGASKRKEKYGLRTGF